MKIFCCGVALSVFQLSLVGSAWAGPAETILHAFTGSDGATPTSGLIADSKGNLYGTTAYGGASGFGTVFELSPPAVAGETWTERVLYNFKSGADGAIPDSDLVADGKGNIYGMTENGGGSGVGSGYGTVFELSPPTSGGSWTETVLLTFKRGNDGNIPGAGLIMDSQGNLYGTAFYGGETADFEGGSGYGVVFELSPPTSGGAWTETVLHTFTGGNDGAGPEAKLIADNKGNLYGAAQFGGSAVGQSGYGLVFELSPPAVAGGPWTETVLHTFTGGNDGAYPTSLITDSKGNLYGTTFLGGTALGFSGSGVVFKLSPPAVIGETWTETVLYSFKGSNDGASPAGLIADSKGNLYGTTGYGGTAVRFFGYGLAFELSSPPAPADGTWTETVLHTFTGGSDGALPSGLIADSKGNLYGTTNAGGAASGASGYGVVFELTNTGFVTNTPFAAFRSNLEIHFGKRPNTDAFELFSEFTLGSASTGINPLTDPVTLTIGTFTATIPPGSFRKERNGPFIFAGKINGADLEARIAQTGEKRFEFAAEARKADLAGTTNPVPVTLTIGNNTGTDSIKHPERGW